MSKKGSIRIQKGMISDAKLFARPTMVKDSNERIWDFERERQNAIHELMNRRAYPDPDADWGCGTADMYKVAKTGIIGVLNNYKPPKMVLTTLINASDGSRTCYAEDFHNELFHQSRDGRFWNSNCPLSKRAKELSVTWVKYFVDARDEFALDMFNLFVQVFNNERLLHDHLTIDDMIRALGGYSDQVFMFELNPEDQIILEDEYEPWWKDIKHRNVANRFMLCAHEYSSVLTPQMKFIADYHMVTLRGNHVQDLFEQERYLREAGHKDCQAELIEAYNNQNDPLATPIYPEVATNGGSPNWLFLAEAYQVSDLWCRRYGL